MTFIIDKNIPISQKIRPSKYPFAQMENGDSFAIPLDGKTAKQLSTNIHNHARHQNVRVVVRGAEDHIRVWKIDTLTNQE